MPSSVDMLDRGGRVARQLPGYEVRPQQLDMTRAVADAFENEEHLVVEAGTGVGKSFAYLIPAVERVLESGGRVVVSTNTIALQEQLISKDIPFLQKALFREFSAVLVKGRSNYLGLRRLARASERQELLLSKKEREELWKIEEWAYETEDGSRSDLKKQPSPDLWGLVNSDRSECMGRRCPHRDACFYQRARSKTSEAHLLVVNHALLFSDLTLRRGGAAILPDYDYVVLDEAHTVEGVAGDHFGLSISDTQVRFLLSALYNDKTKRGLLAGGPGEAAIPVVRETRYLVDGYFKELAYLRREKPDWNGRLVEPPPVQERASTGLNNLGESLKSVRNDFEDEQARFEVTSLMNRCKDFASSISHLHAQDEDGCVYWLEVGGLRRGYTALHGRPIDVGPVMREVLFDAVKSVVLTSATLTTGGDPPFGYVQKRLGLGEADCKVLGSPFNYHEQVTVHIEPQMPAPSDSKRFTEAVAEAMKKYLLMSKGRAFALFTSYRMLDDCAELIEAFLAQHKMPLLKQGSGMPRSRMLSRFRKEPGSVLFGTDTFWGGVDVPGEALSNVIITKLPFTVPNHPITEARIEHIRQQGGRPFMELQLPEAILKLKQGFGRLIRTRTDRGTVVILDPRVLTKPYGRRFLTALPDCRVVVHDGSQTQPERP